MTKEAETRFPFSLLTFLLPRSINYTGSQSSENSRASGTFSGMLPSGSDAGSRASLRGLRGRAPALGLTSQPWSVASLSPDDAGSCGARHVLLLSPCVFASKSR